jgi:hypothetical protein
VAIKWLEYKYLPTADATSYSAQQVIEELLGDKTQLELPVVVSCRDGNMHETLTHRRSQE